MPVFEFERLINTPVKFTIKAPTIADALDYSRTLDEGELVQAHVKDHEWYFDDDFIEIQQIDDDADFDYEVEEE